jgi:hypothetical protein
LDFKNGGEMFLGRKFLDPRKYAVNFCGTKKIVFFFRYLGNKNGVLVSLSKVKPSPILQDSIKTVGTGKAPRITTFIVEDKTILQNDGIRKIQDVLVYLPGTLAKDDDGKKVTVFSFFKLNFISITHTKKKKTRDTCAFLTENFHWAADI